MKYAWIEHYRDEYTLSRLCFFKMLKVERIYQVRYDTWAQARLDIVDWIEGFYNRVRLQTAIGHMAPATKERSLLAA